MLHQYGRLGRSLMNSGRVYCSILNLLESPRPWAGIGFSSRHNALYGADEFARCALHAAASNGSMHSSASALRRWSDGRMPTDEWYRALLADVEPGVAGAAVASTGASQLARAGRLPATCMVAIDMHDIPRYDGRPGEDVARGREYRGTTFFERCATAQCEEGGSRVTLAFAPVGIHDGTAGIVRGLVRDAAAACRAAGSEPVFVMDRGFQSVAVLRVLRGEGVRYAMPCRNTGRVVDALRERDAGLRGRVSRITMEGQDRTEEEITVVIVPRRKSRGGRAAEQRLIAFAVSDPKVDVEKYALRQGIESWYRELERARVRTSARGAGARAMCLAISLLILNAWAVTNGMLADESSWRAAAGAQHVPHAAFSHELTLLAYWGRLRPEPPPEPILP